MTIFKSLNFEYLLQKYKLRGQPTHHIIIIINIEIYNFSLLLYLKTLILLTNRFIYQDYNKYLIYLTKKGSSNKKL